MPHTPPPCARARAPRGQVVRAAFAALSGGDGTLAGGITFETLQAACKRYEVMWVRARVRAPGGVVCV